MRSLRGIFFWVVLGMLSVPPGSAAGPSWRRLDDGVVVSVEDRHLKLQIRGEDIFRVLFAPQSSFFDRDSLMTHGSPCRQIPWALESEDDQVVISTPKLTARIGLHDGTLSFLDADGRILLVEKRGGGKSVVPAEVRGEKTYHVRAEFEPSAGEALYGLGQHQNGLMGYQDHDVDLYQHNIVAIVPFLVSSLGYGLLWDNTSYTRFGDLREPELIPASRLYDSSGRIGGLTGTYHQGSCSEPAVATRVDPQIDFGAPEDRPPVGKIHQAEQPINERIHPRLGEGEVCVVWRGEIHSEAAGDYDLITFGNNGIQSHHAPHRPGLRLADAQRLYADEQWRRL